MSEAIWERSRSAPGRAASRTRLAGHQPLRRAPDFLWLTRTHVADDARNRPCIIPPGVNSDRRNGTRLPDAPYAPPPPPARSRALDIAAISAKGMDCGLSSGIGGLDLFLKINSSRTSWFPYRSPADFVWFKMAETDPVLCFQNKSFRILGTILYRGIVPWIPWKRGCEIYPPVLAPVSKEV